MALMTTKQFFKMEPTLNKNCLADLLFVWIVCTFFFYS